MQHSVSPLMSRIRLVLWASGLRITRGERWTDMHSESRSNDGTLTMWNGGRVRRVDLRTHDAIVESVGPHTYEEVRASILSMVVEETAIGHDECAIRAKYRFAWPNLP